MTISKQTICNIIKSSRRYNHENHKKKTISIRINEEHNHPITARTHITFNIKTGAINITHGLKYIGREYYPSVYGKQNCNSEEFRNHLSNIIEQGQIKNGKQIAKKYRESEKGRETTRIYQEKRRAKYKLKNDTTLVE